MGTPLHGRQVVADGIHAPISFDYANATERTSATGFQSYDLHKFAHQEDNDSIWMLTQVSPPAWIEVTATALTQVTLDRVVIPSRKSTAGTIAKGQVVYLVGHDTPNALATVELADADDATKMPAIGIALDTFTEAIPGGNVMVIGKLLGVDTSGMAVRDEVYVSATAGAFTKTKPVYPGQVQPIGTVLEVDAVNGVLYVLRTRPRQRIATTLGIAASTASTSYTKLGGAFIYPGTSVEVLRKVKAVAYANNANGGQIRVYDATNAQVIAESGTITSLTPAIVDLGAISNLPSGEAIFEVQAKRNSPATLYVESLSLEV